MKKYFIIFLLTCTPWLLQASSDSYAIPDACAQGQKIVIAAVGDILLHHPLQLKASKSGFASLWEEAIPFLKAADIAFANLEGPIYPNKINPLGWDFKAYSSYPAFNYHPSLAPALYDTGFTIVSTANNHALDRASQGIDATLVALDQSGVKYVGSVARGENLEIFKVVEAKGIRVAFIACAENTNGINDKYNQVLHCYKPDQKQRILRTISDLKTKVDVIIVTPHWGEEYQVKNNRKQEQFAHDVLEAGATAVIGSHPHVLQPIEKYTTHDRPTTLISYSLGNFVSFQAPVKTRSTVILLLGLTKTAEKTIVNGFRFVPMMMMNRSGTDQIQLEKLKPSDQLSPAFEIIKKAFPLGNALFSLPLVTNQECNSSTL